MKKLVHVVESFASGVFTFLTELCNSTWDVYDITVIYSTRCETPENFKDFFNKDIRFIKLDMCRGLDPGKNLKSLIELYSILKEIHPDVVHLHSSKAGFLGRVVCFMLRLDMDNVFYNPHGYSFLQINESRLKTSTYYLLEKLAAAFGGWTVGCSSGEYLQASKISRRCLNINNGIDTVYIDKIISREALKKRGNKIILGTMGRICHQKNPTLFNAVADKLPQYDFIWIGDGELRSELTSENILITGWLDREKALEKLAEINIFILTSLWEGMPLSLLEAMYMGKPVIASNAYGNRDIVQHGVYGYSAEKLEDYLEFICLINQNGTFYLEAESNYILVHYNKSKMVQSYLELYENNKVRVI